MDPCLSMLIGTKVCIVIASVVMVDLETKENKFLDKKCLCSNQRLMAKLLNLIDWSNLVYNLTPQ